MANYRVLAERACGNVIPFPSRGKDQEHEFFIRFHAAHLLRAQAQLAEARCMAARSLETEEIYENVRREYWRTWDDYVEAVNHLAELPAMTRRQLELKRRSIGKVWLSEKTKGHTYDRYREVVAADEARIDGLYPKRRRLAKPLAGG
jgi:hypothetical protein